jgi:hypothetical protein
VRDYRTDRVLYGVKTPFRFGVTSEPTMNVRMAKIVGPFVQSWCRLIQCRLKSRRHLR